MAGAAFEADALGQAEVAAVEMESAPDEVAALGSHQGVASASAAVQSLEVAVASVEATAQQTAVA